MNRPLLVALAAVVCVAAPLLWGDGVDLPDDALYYGVASWEWLARSAAPFWVPGKLGGVSLFADVVPQGPFYPSAWLGRILPVVPAMGLAAMLHAVGTLCAVRWLARLQGIRRELAWLAGAGVAAGPLAVWAAIDFQVDAWPTFLWFPVVLGCLECSAEAARLKDRGSWVRWVALGAMAVAALLLGSHLRLGIAAGGALALWALLRGKDLLGAALTGGLGLLGGAPAVLPMLAEASAQGAGGGSPSLGTPPDLALGFWNLPGWLAPKVMLFDRDLGIGLVLGIGVVLGAVQLREARWRRWGLFAVLLLLAGSRVPGARQVLAPLTLLTHPVNLVYAALALIPLSLLGAAGLERALEERRGGSQDRRVVLWLLGGLLALALLRLGAGQAFPSSWSRALYGLAILQAAGILAALWRWRGVHALVLLGVLDLLLFGLRAHLAVPSEPLRSTGALRGDRALLVDGFLDVEDLARGFEAPRAPGEPASSRAGRAQTNEEEVVVYEEEAPQVQARLLERRWPVHAPMAVGGLGLAGRSKMPPRRSSALLAPVAEELADLDGDPDVVAHLFAEGGRGWRLLEVFGAQTAMWGEQVVARRAKGDGPCTAYGRVTVEPEEAARVRRLLDRAGGSEPALLEAELPPGPSLGPAPMFCSEVGDEIRAQVEVPTGRRALLGVRRPLHPGWRVRDRGLELRPVPVDQVHQAVLLDAGPHELVWRFEPPRLELALRLGAAGWGLMLLGLLGGVMGARRARRALLPLLCLLAPLGASALPLRAELVGAEEGVRYELLATDTLDLSEPDAVLARVPFVGAVAQGELDHPPSALWFFLHQSIPRAEHPALEFYRPLDLLPSTVDALPALSFRAVPRELALLRARDEAAPGWWRAPLLLSALVLLGFPLLRRRLLRGTRGASVRPSQASPLASGPRSPVSGRERAGLLALLGLALALRLPGFADSLDLLEWSYGPGTLRVWDGEQGWLDRLLHPACLELVHPPLWHLLSGGLWQLSGGAEWALRLPALLASLATVALLWWLLRSTGAGLVAAGLLVVAPPAVQFGRDATPYALLSLAAVGSLWLMLRALRAGTLGAWLAWVGCLVAAFLCHYGAVFFAAGEIGALLAMAWTGRADPRWRLAASQALRAASWLAPVALAWSALHFANFGPTALDTRLYADTYPADPGFLPFLSAFASVGLGATPSTSWLATLVLAGGALGAWRSRTEAVTRGLLALAAAFLLGVGFFYANLVGELDGRVFWGFRWVSWFVPVALGLAALALPQTQGARRIVVGGGLALFALGSLADPLIPGDASTRPDYRAAAEHIAQGLEDRDGLVALPLWGQRGPVRTYLSERLEGDFGPIHETTAWRFGDRAAYLEMADERFPIESSLRNGHVDRVWVVVADERMFGAEKFRGAVAEQAVRWADAHLERLETRSFEHLTLTLYARGPLPLPPVLDPSGLAALRFLEPNVVPCGDGDERWELVVRGEAVERASTSGGVLEPLSETPFAARIRGGDCAGPAPQLRFE